VKIAIVIIHYNTSGDLERCLESLTAYPPSCEHAIVVVDNASQDPGLAAVQDRFRSVHWICNRENTGYSQGANLGMATVAADYYLVLNPDIVALPGAVDRLLAFADSHPKAGLIGPQLLNEDQSIQDSCRRFYTFRTLLMRRTFLGKLFPRSRTMDEHLMRDFDHQTARPVDWVLGGCILVRRTALERTGPMDERFFLYFEDVDLCYRMWQAGWEVLYTPDARFVHRHRRDSAKGALSRSFWLHLGSLISFYEKWGMLVYLLKKWRGPLVVFLLWAVDMVSLWVAFLGAYGLRAVANPLFAEPVFPLVEYRPLLLFGSLLATVTFLLAGRYRLRGRGRPMAALAHLQQVGIVSLLLLASTYLGRQEVISRAVLLLFVPLFAFTAAVGADLFASLRRRLEHGFLSLERTLLVGAPATLQPWLARLGGQRLPGVDLVGYLAEPAAAAGEAPPPLAGGELPWLGSWSDLADVVERYRVSQVVLGEQPQPGSAEFAAVARLRHRRIRLRWHTDDLWLLAAGARPELFGGQLSAVLEPGSGSVLQSFLARLSGLGGGVFLLVVGLLPAAWLRLVSIPAGRARIRPLAATDGWGRDVELRLACRTDGTVLPLWWQLTLCGSLLRGRLNLVGSRLAPRAEVEPVQSHAEAAEFWRRGRLRPGLTGSWAVSSPAATAPAFSFAGTWAILKDMVSGLLRNPGGFGRLGPVTDFSPPGSHDSRSHREVF